MILQIFPHGRDYLRKLYGSNLEIWKERRFLILVVEKGLRRIISLKKNDVTAIEPSKEMLSNAWKDYEYTQIVGDVNALSVGTSMMIIRKIKKSWKIQHLVLNNHSLWSILYMSRHV